MTGVESWRLRGRQAQAGSETSSTHTLPLPPSACMHHTHTFLHTSPSLPDPTLPPLPCPCYHHHQCPQCYSHLPACLFLPLPATTTHTHRSDYTGDYVPFLVGDDPMPPPTYLPPLLFVPLTPPFPVLPPTRHRAIPARCVLDCWVLFFTRAVCSSCPLPRSLRLTYLFYHLPLPHTPVDFTLDSCLPCLPPATLPFTTFPPYCTDFTGPYHHHACRCSFYLPGCYCHYLHLDSYGSFYLHTCS